MNDTLLVKDLATSTIGATQLPGAARTFARVASSDNKVHLRQSNHLGSLSPTVIRIQHTPRSSKSAVQRSVLALDQTLGRLDAQSNLLESVKFSIKIQSDIPEGVTEAEWKAALATLLGGLLEADAALAIQFFYAQQ